MIKNTGMLAQNTINPPTNQGGMLENQVYKNEGWS